MNNSLGYAGATVHASQDADPPHGSKASRRQVYLNARICKEAPYGAQQLLNFIGQVSDELSLVNLCTALHKLARCSKEGRGVSDSDPRFKQLLAQTRLAMRHELRQESPPDARCWATLAWSYANLRVTAEEDLQCLQLVGDYAARHIGAFQRIELTNLLWSFARLRVSNRNLFYSSESRIIELMPSFTQSNLSTLVWALVTLQHLSSQGLLRRIAERFIDVLSAWSEKSAKPHANPTDIANFVWALATAQIRLPSRRMRTVGDFAAQTLDAFKLHELSITVWAFSRLGFRHDQLFLKAVTLLQSSPKLRYQIHPQGIANTLWAFSRQVDLESGVSDQLHAAALTLVPTCARLFNQLQPLELSSTLWALTKLGARGGIDPGIDELFHAAASISDKFLSQLSLHSCINLMGAFARFVKGREELVPPDCMNIQRALANTCFCRLKNLQPLSERALLEVMISIPNPPPEIVRLTSEVVKAICRDIRRFNRSGIERLIVIMISLHRHYADILLPVVQNRLAELDAMPAGNGADANPDPDDDDNDFCEFDDLEFSERRARNVFEDDSLPMDNNSGSAGFPSDRHANRSFATNERLGQFATQREDWFEPNNDHRWHAPGDESSQQQSSGDFQEFRRRDRDPDHQSQAGQGAWEATKPTMYQNNENQLNNDKLEIRRNQAGKDRHNFSGRQARQWPDSQPSLSETFDLYAQHDQPSSSGQPNPLGQRLRHNQPHEQYSQEKGKGKAHQKQRLQNQQRHEHKGKGAKMRGNQQHGRQFVMENVQTWQDDEPGGINIKPYKPAATFNGPYTREKQSYDTAVMQEAEDAYANLPAASFYDDENSYHLAQVVDTRTKASVSGRYIEDGSQGLQDTFAESTGQKEHTRRTGLPANRFYSTSTTSTASGTLSLSSMTTGQPLHPMTTRTHDTLDAINRENSETEISATQFMSGLGSHANAHSIKEKRLSPNSFSSLQPRRTCDEETAHVPSQETTHSLTKLSGTHWKEPNSGVPNVHGGRGVGHGRRYDGSRSELHNGGDQLVGQPRISAHNFRSVQPQRTCEVKWHEGAAYITRSQLTGSTNAAMDCTGFLLEDSEATSRENTGCSAQPHDPRQQNSALDSYSQTATGAIYEWNSPSQVPSTNRQRPSGDQGCVANEFPASSYTVKNTFVETIDADIDDELRSLRIRAQNFFSAQPMRASDASLRVAAGSMAFDDLLEDDTSDIEDVQRA